MCFVEQLKARSDGRTWSLKELIEDVLPDLYQAVDPNTPSRYYLVTEGRQGVWKDACTFFRSLAKFSASTFKLEALDDNRTIACIGGSDYTERFLFEHIVSQCHRQGSTADAAAVQKVHHLLSNFRTRYRLTSHDLKQRVLRFFESVIDDPDDATKRLHEASAWIIEQAASGDLQITAGLLQRKLGLPDWPLMAWNKSRRAAMEYCKSQFKVHGYETSHRDVRASASSDLNQIPSRPVTLMPGESGQGNTWRSARLATELAREKSLVLWISAEKSAADTVSKIESAVWSGAWRRYSQPPQLDQLERIFAKQATVTLNNWLVVIIDDVRSYELAKAIVLKAWEQWRVRIFVSVTPVIAQRLQDECGERVALMPELQSFRSFELRTLLQSAGVNPDLLPSDVLDLIKRPILAGIYLKIRRENEWVPENEYDICHKYLELANDLDHPSDIHYLRELVLRITQLNQYPWGIADLRAVGLNDDSARRLENRGWLRRSAEGDRFDLWHDRLVSWALADSLVAKLRFENMTQADFVQAVLESSEGSLAGRSGRLGYLLGDVLWKLTSKDSQPRLDDATALVHAIGQEGGYRGQALIDFYRHVLASLGEQVLPLLDSVVKVTSENDAVGFDDAVSAAMKRLHGQYAEACSALLDSWLRSESTAVNSFAINCLVNNPSETHLDTAWKYHLGISEKLHESEKKVDYYHDYSNSSKALRRMASASPEWISQQIRSVEGDERSLSELAWLLSASPAGDIDGAWPELKQILFKTLSGKNDRALIACIERFNDHGEINHLKQWSVLDDQGHLAGFAFSVLCKLDSSKAIELIDSVSGKVLYLFRHTWLPILLDADQRYAQKAIREHIEATEDGHAGSPSIYQGNEHLIDVETLSVLLSRLERLIDLELNRKPDDKRHYTYIPLSILNGPLSLECMRHLRSYANSELEGKLVTLGVYWSRKWEHKNGNSEIWDLIHLLHRIGGHGLSKVINQELQADLGRRWYIGSRWAPACSDKETIALLKQTLAEFEALDEPDDNHRIDAGSAVQALIAVGQVADAVQVLGIKNDIALLGSTDIFKESIPSISDSDSRIIIDLARKRGHKSWPLLYLAASTNHPNAASMLRELFDATGPDEPLAGSIIDALCSANGFNEDDIPKLKPFLSAPKTSGYAANALFELGIKHLSSEFEAATADGIGRDRWRQAAWLYEHLEDGSQLLDHLVDEVVKQPRSYDSYEMFRVICHSPRHEVGELLRKVASQDHPDAGAGAAALGGLLIHDVDSARALTYAAWSTWGRDRHLLPSITLQADPSSGVKFLIEKAIGESDPVVRRSIGIQLREHDDQKHVYETLIAKIDTNDVSARCTAVELMGWLAPNSSLGVDSLLRSIGLSACSDLVSREAVRSLERRLREVKALELVDEAKQHEECALSLLLSAVKMVDPVLFQSSSRWIEFWSIYDRMSPLNRQILDGVIKGRERDVDNKLSRKSHGW